MKAIEVLLNGQRLCIAGSGPPEFTWAAITLFDGDNPKAELSIAGSRAKMVVLWTDEQVIQAGDEVLLRIVEVEEADPPVASTPQWTEFPSIKLDL